MQSVGSYKCGSKYCGQIFLTMCAKLAHERHTHSVLPLQTRRSVQTSKKIQQQPFPCGSVGGDSVIQGEPFDAREGGSDYGEDAMQGGEFDALSSPDGSVAGAELYPGRDSPFLSSSDGHVSDDAASIMEEEKVDVFVEEPQVIAQGAEDNRCLPRGNESNAYPPRPCFFIPSVLKVCVLPASTSIVVVHPTLLPTSHLILACSYAGESYLFGHDRVACYYTHARSGRE